jgi:hypothetical protein
MCFLWGTNWIYIYILFRRNSAFKGLNVPEKRMPRKMYGQKRKEQEAEEICVPRSFIIRRTQVILLGWSKQEGWEAGIVACMGVVAIVCNRKDCFRHLDIDGRIILKRALKEEWVTVWAGLNWLRTGGWWTWQRVIWHAEQLSAFQGNSFFFMELISASSENFEVLQRWVCLHRTCRQRF